MKGGILAKKSIPDGLYADVGQEIGLVVAGKKEYMDYLDAIRIAQADNEHLHDVEERREENAAAVGR